MVALLFFFRASTALSAATTDPYPIYPPGISSLNFTEIRFRLLLMGGPVSPVYNEEVEAYIRRYLTYGAADSEAILGRSVALFPIFEHYLAAYGLPDELKFLPIVESELVPYAVSVKGAAGLWQFIPSTARAMGLVVDQYLDERKDPYKSTEAAVKYLKRLFERFGTWELALAAYNCGPTRVSRVLQNSDCADFWKIRDQLPRETQRYVSRYLAASYLANYYTLHGITPVWPTSAALDVMAARIYKSLSLPTVAKLTGLDVATIKQLNPAINKAYVPAIKNGFFLVLPRASWYDYLDAQSRVGVVQP